jgi:hypothetical protein
MFRFHAFEFGAKLFRSSEHARSGLMNYEYLLDKLPNFKFCHHLPSHYCIDVDFTYQGRYPQLVDMNNQR